MEKEYHPAVAGNEPAVTRRDACIHEWFETQASRRPEATALVHEGQALSYAKLNRRANRLAHHLRTLGVGPDTRVVILMERCLETVVAMLAILKAGGAYVPLDLAAPPERLAYMLRDTAPVAVLVHAHTASHAALHGAGMSPPVLDLQGGACAWANEPAVNLGCASIGLRADHLACVIYTSGSTGVPKGVMVEHRNVVALVAANTFAPISPDDCIAHCANPAFDASTWEVWAALLNGARVHVVSQSEVLEPARLARQLCEGGVTALWLTVALFNAYVDEIGEALARLRVLIVGGDVLNPRTMTRLLASDRAPEYVLNGYGPTETTTFASTYELTRAPEPLSCGSSHASSRVPIGKPIAGTAIYILDEAGQPVTNGATGEIHIGGAGVARGYLNRAELTAERFVPDPFGACAEARMYRTGDLGCWLSDGNIEFLGRNDRQVKIRGFRVEPGEIEARLEACAGVRDAVVIAREDSPGDKRLVAYLTTQAHAPWLPSSVSALRNALAAVLPDYMMPAAFVRLDALPLTPNGKLDRQALPAPDAQARAHRRHEAPVGDTECLLGRLWAELLGVKQVEIGRYDHFFELGGHSLLAARLIGRLRRQLGGDGVGGSGGDGGGDITVSELFAHPVLADFAAVVAGTDRADGFDACEPAIPPADRTQALPLSWAQQRLWFLDQLDARAGLAYHLSFAYRLRGPLLPESLQWALDRLVQRHESLRTSFVDVEGVPVQVVAAAESTRIELLAHDLSPLDSAAREVAAQALLTQACQRPFDLGAGPLMRAMLLRLAPDVHQLLLVQHHIVSDGWSVGVMLAEVAALYNAHAAAAAVEAGPVPVPELELELPLELQYADYAAWQQLPAQRDGVRSRLPFWCEQLRGAPAVLDLPTDRPRPARQSHRGDVLVFSLAPELSAALQRFNRRHGLTLFMSLLTGWAALLARLCGQDDLVIGTPVANRPQPELEPLIGFFANTLALRIGLHDDPRVGELAARVKALALAAYAHEDVPFEQVVDALQPARSLGHNPLFQTMLALNNTPAASTLALHGLEVQAFDLPQRSTQFDLSLSFDEGGVPGAGLQAQLEYARDLFDRASVQRISEYFQTLLAAMVVDDALPISQLPLLSGPQRQQLLTDFNATARSYPDAACVHELFEAQVARTPTAVAVVWELRQAQTLSYAELNRQANRLAHRLITLGVGPDARVGVCCERSADMVVGLLAILKAGGAYVPLDPVYPVARLNAMLQDSGAVAVLLGGGGTSLDTATLPVLDLHASASWADEADSNPQVDRLTSQHLAYVIYTSGSTGAPKGVMVEHASVVNLLHTHVRIAALTPADAVLQFASFSFDSSVEEIFSSLSVGARIVLKPPQLLAPDAAFMQWLDAQRITVAELPTAFWHQWAQQVGAQQEEPSRPPPERLRLVVIGGEKAERRHLDQWRASALGRRCQWLNSYGPTEATVYATALLLDANDELAEGEISIGKPTDNSRLYIRDKTGQPVPIGVSGEIHIGGRQVARGYLNRPELTAQRFIADPFNAEPAARMYRTGDLGRWRADGSIEYLGRNDQQVKIRGFRIELGEIEARLAEHPSVREAVVLAREHGPGDLRLVAYVTTDITTAAPQALDIEALRRHLSAALPEHMVPAAYVALASLPLTPNGKLDRQALPAPAADSYLSQTYEAPVGEVETALARIWAELLQHEPADVGRHANFFALGGHSLLAATLVSRVRSRLQVDVALSDLFAHPVLAAFARIVGGAVCSEVAAIPALPRNHPLPLSFAQQRLWFLAQMGGVSEAYHMPIGLRLVGDLNRAALKRALDRIVERHEALRTTFHRHGDAPMQHFADPGCGFALEQHDLRHHSDPAAELERRMRFESNLPFDLAQGPLGRGQLLQLADREHVMLITLHHIVGDGWSFGVLARELSALYRADPLPALPIQYADYAVWQRRWLTGAELRRQSAYWREALQGAPTLLSLPTDRPRPPEQSFEGERIAVELDAGLTTALKVLAQRHGMTLYMLALAAWAAVLARLAGQDEVVIGTSMANRTRTEVEGLIGFFVNSQAMRVPVTGNVNELLAKVKARALGAQEHQELPFEEIMDILKPSRSLAHTAIFQVMLAWQNHDGDGFSLPGLTVSPLTPAYDLAKFDLLLELGEVGDTLAGSLVYATALFDRGTAQRHAGYLQRMLAVLGADELHGQQAVESIDLLSAPQRQQVLVDFNATAQNFPSDESVHALFEAQVARTPAAVAVVVMDEAHTLTTLTYGELNRQANRLAHRLITLGVGPDARVAICCERSAAMVVGLLAILKAGGAYVPLDPVYPAARLNSMLRDSGAVAVLLGGAVRLDTAALPVLDLHATAQGDAEADANPAVNGLTPQQLAYVIYTSGSTGAPKGVMVEHASVVNLVRTHVDNCALTPADAVLQFASFSFDASVEEIFAPLSVGARIVLRPAQLPAPDAAFMAWLDAQRITVAELPTAFWHQWAQQDGAQQEEPGAPLAERLRLVVVGGEKAERRHLDAWRASALGRHCQWLNTYGPTEATVYASALRLDGGEELPEGERGGEISIGKPIANTRLYILDKTGQPTPIGVAGEIHIAGRQVARGYLNRPELTAQRFVADPFNAEPTARMYKSGDLGRWRVDGSIEYLGRNDQQVKLRGFRIELGEIEARLAEHASVREAVVLARADVVGDKPGDKRLVAYVTSSSSEALDIEALRRHLSATLPEHMVPAAYVALLNLPLTPNGKLDAQALPAPDAHAYASRAYEAPVGDVETALARIWAELLQHKPGPGLGLGLIGRHDNFFALGGHSLLAITLVERMRQAELRTEVRHIFAAPTLADLAAMTEEIGEIVL